MSHTIAYYSAIRAAVFSGFFLSSLACLLTLRYGTVLYGTGAGELWM